MTVTFRFIIILSFCLSAAASAAEARILKVLPHLLDAQGRNALAPSLYERDAYQAQLRSNPENISALRFDVQYKSRSKELLVLRIELRGSKMPIGQSRIFETDLQPRRFLSSWGELRLNKELYEEIGPILAWRATLRRNGAELAEQQSLLW
jgi:hypothetical protein